jgi:hypothetical protein
MTAGRAPVALPAVRGKWLTGSSLNWNPRRRALIRNSALKVAPRAWTVRFS